MADRRHADGGGECAEFRAVTVRSSPGADSQLAAATCFSMMLATRTGVSSME